MQAVGGEVPDTIQSLACAKKGYGSLAVANCIGAQVRCMQFMRELCSTSSL